MILNLNFTLDQIMAILSTFAATAGFIISRKRTSSLFCLVTLFLEVIKVLLFRNIVIIQMLVFSNPVGLEKVWNSWFTAIAEILIAVVLSRMTAKNIWLVIPTAIVVADLTFAILDINLVPSFPNNNWQSSIAKFVVCLIILVAFAACCKGKGKGGE